MSYKFAFIAILSICFLQCKENSEIEIHKSLIGFKSVWAGDMEDDEFKKSEKKINKNKIIIDYKDGYLIATNWNYSNACGQSIANLKISNDSINLKYIEIRDELCTSQRIDKVTYFIDNPKNKKWIIY